MKKAPEGHCINVGDIIVAKHSFGNNKWEVKRVTPKYAFVMYNDTAEGKFPRIFDFGFQSFPKDNWNTTDYTVYINEK